MSPMLTLQNPADSLRGDEAQALMKEARRRHRRRWAARLLTGAVVLGAAAAIAALSTSSTRSPTAAGSGVAAGLPTGAVATLNVAGPLAVGSSGALYVVDVADHRVLVRLPDGHFRVVAGNGTAGFAGDGGPAVRAELSSVSDLAFSPAGSLYIVDGGRIRVVGHNGVIHTIAGDGHEPRAAIASGTSALSAPLGSERSIARNGNPISIAFSPSGTLYMSTGSTLSTNSQLLRLTATGTLATVRDVVGSGFFRGRHLNDLGPIAIDARGNIDVAGFNGWAIWQVTPNGLAHQIGVGFPESQARRSGGNYSVLERGPSGAVYGENGPTILRIEGQRLVPTFPLGGPIHGQYFELTYFALGPKDTVYADDIPGGGGFEAHQQLLAVRHSRTSLVWQESNATAH